MATYRTILTNKGLALIAAAGASGVPIVLTDMAVGDGNGNPTTPDPAQTSLARERYRHAVNQLTVNPNDPTQFTGELIVPADIGGFTMREVGLYTIDGDLFAVANVPNAYKPTDAEGSFGDTVIRMVFKVSNASVVTIVIDPNVTVATHTWVLNNVNAATMIPGGVTDQILAKRSNADGDVEWRDPAAGFTVIVFSREETQTLAASQTVVDLADITAEGVAVYIEGVRLRGGEFTQTGAAQVTLAQSYPAGTQVTAVQNEEVGNTDMLLRPNNLADVPDKAAARTNLGLVNWLAGMNIAWNQLTSLPAYATRWPTWNEVSDRPAQYPPAPHNQSWMTITDAPETATRWPTWNEVSSKPSTFTPAAHSHAEYLPKTAGDTQTLTGTLCMYAGVGATLSWRNGGNTSQRYYTSHNDTEWAFCTCDDAGGFRAVAFTVQRGGGQVNIGSALNAPNVYVNDSLYAQKVSYNDSTQGFQFLWNANGAENGYGANEYINNHGGGGGGHYFYSRSTKAGPLVRTASVTRDGRVKAYPGAGTNPNSSVDTLGFVASGSFGGGFGMIDGTQNIGLWSSFGVFNIGFGTGGGALVSKLTLSTAGALAATGGFDFGSSLKLKDIEGVMPYGLREVRQVATLIGRYKPEYCDDGRRRVFFDADMLAGIMPELVDRQAIEFNGEKVASIKLDQVMPPAYRAIAELADIVDALRAEVAALKAAR